MSDLQAITALTADDELDVRLRVVDVKPSAHKWYGTRDLLVVELVEDAGDLPAGLRFQVRRPHDGTADLRSDERKAKSTPVIKESMKKDDLLALAKERGVEVAPKATKTQILAALQ